MVPSLIPAKKLSRHRLAAYQFMEEMLGVLVFEDADGCFQLSAGLLVEALHQQQRDGFVFDVFDQCVFQCMRHRPVSYVVQQHGYLRSQAFFLGYYYPFFLQCAEGFGDQMVGSDGMSEACMHGSGIYVVGGSQLFEPGQPYHDGMSRELCQ